MDINMYFNKFTFKINELYKGKIKIDTIEIITGMGHGDCGYEFEIGKSYVVYASKRNKFYEEGAKVTTFLYTDICFRTTEQVEEERAKIEKYRKPCKK